jgi:hypothetical protein
MNLSRRVVVAILFTLIILLAGVLFWPFILNEIITPISLAAWLLLRILVLSIDQKYYWGAIIFGVLFFLYRLLPQGQDTFLPDDFLDTNATIKTIEYWRSLFTLTEHNLRDEKSLKKELIRLLLLFYATKQRTSADFRLYESLQRGEIPLPEHIRAFLFPEEPQKTGRSFKKWMNSLKNAPRTWIRRWTRQDVAEYYRMVDETLSFMETALEIKNDAGKLNPNQH